MIKKFLFNDIIDIICTNRYLLYLLVRKNICVYCSICILINLVIFIFMWLLKFVITKVEKS